MVEPRVVAEAEREEVLKKAYAVVLAWRRLELREEDEEETSVGPARKREKVATNVSRGSSAAGRGRGRGRGGGHTNTGGVIQGVARGRGGGVRGSATKLPVQNPIKTVSGSSGKVT